ncbi:hypothetical protein Nepgr_033508 [Nepenthes gracilis]|uniref:Uncharacterized protein n=1 Tax=Nepenthes gracilis TaxID=150966 RepID=A0AAD3Y8Q2_NEPGR|nr:hypothetical protein Nepgr_033508 [Nepenthes gracilis]
MVLPDTHLCPLRGVFSSTSGVDFPPLSVCRRFASLRSLGSSKWLSEDSAGSVAGEHSNQVADVSPLLGKGSDAGNPTASWSSVVKKDSLGATRLPSSSNLALPLIAKKVNQLNAFSCLQSLSSSDTSVDSKVSALSIQEAETKGPYCDGAPPSAFSGSPSHLQNASPS